MKDFFAKLFGHSRSEADRKVSSAETTSVPPGLDRGTDIPWQPNGSVRCLATAAFLTGTRDMCGQLWLLSTDPELMASYGTDAPLPNVFSAQGFTAPLGIITANCFGDCFFLVDKGELQDLLTAIRSADASRLHSLNEEYVPFYCPHCGVNYSNSEWFTGPVYDDGFFDYLEGTCPQGHRRMIHD